MPPDFMQANPNAVRRLLMVRLSAMGDIIHTLPAVAALRKAFPQAMLGWLVEERWADLIGCCQTPPSGGRPLVDKIHTVNTKVWRQALSSHKTWREATAAIRQIRCVKYDTAIDFQGAVRSALLARLTGASSLVGFAEPRENAASLFYTKKVFAQGRHIIEQNLTLASVVAGHKLQLGQIEFDSAPPEAGGLSDYAIINPGAGWGAKRWPAERYGEVAKRLASEAGLRSLINYGPGEEGLVRPTEQASGGAARSLTCPPAAMIAMMKRARLFVGGDTGPMHLAAALGIPVVAIFGPTDPARNGPFGSRSIVLRNSASKTSLSHRSAPDESMLQIMPEEVVQAALQLLRDRVE